MSRLSLVNIFICTMIIAYSVSTENGNNTESESGGNLVDEKVTKKKSENEMVEIHVSNTNSTLINQTDIDGSQDVIVTSSFNYSESLEDDDIAGSNDTTEESEESEEFHPFHVGHWDLLNCGSNEMSWMCEFQHDLSIPENGIWETLKFVVFGDKLKIGSMSERPKTTKPASAVLPTVIQQSQIFHLRILVQCPSRCITDDCSVTGIYFPSFWLGLLVGIMIGVLSVSCMVASVSAAVPRSDDEEKTKSVYE